MRKILTGAKLLLMSICFGAKIRKIGKPLHTPVFLLTPLKVGFKGVSISRTCFPDDVFVGVFTRSQMSIYSTNGPLALIRDT